MDITKALENVDTNQIHKIINYLPIPVFIIDSNYRFFAVNDSMCDIFNCSNKIFLRKTDDFIIPKKNINASRKITNEIFSSGKPYENEEILTDGRGEQHIFLIYKRLIHLQQAGYETPFVITVLMDVTRFREAEKNATHRALHDTLTGLANRSHLNQRLKEAVTVSTANAQGFAILLLDLDGFKSINDRFGHQAGDQILCVVAKRLTDTIRRNDVVARLGGDEFCIVQANVDHSDQAHELADRVVHAVSRPIPFGSIELTISASVGIALFPEDGDGPDTLLRKADLGLYQVKGNGRAGYLRHALDARSLQSDVRIHATNEWN